MMIITDTPPPTVKRLGGVYNIFIQKNLEISNNGLSKFYVAKQIDITFW